VIETRGLTLDATCPVEWAHPLNTGRVGWWHGWPLSGWAGGVTVRDACGLSAKKTYHATHASGGTWGPGRGPPGRGMYFGGSSANATFAALGTPTTYSWALWVKGDTAPSGAASPTERFPLYLDPGNDAAAFAWDHNNSSFQQAFYARQSGGAYKACKIATALSANVWYFVAGTFDGSNLRVYLNGAPSATTACSGTNAWGSTAGKFSLQSWPGSLADASFWRNRVLSSGDAARLYTESRRGHPETLRWLRPWSFGVTVAAGGSTQTISPAGSVTASGALALSVSKALAGSCTTSGALAKAATKPLAGSTAAAGALAKLTAKPLAGSATGSGALAKQAQKPLAGSVTASGALSSLKVAVLAIAGAVAAAGALVKSVLKSLAGLVTGSGSLATSGGSTRAPPRLAFTLPACRRLDLTLPVCRRKEF
jgi:hypothetical protein